MQFLQSHIILSAILVAAAAHAQSVDTIASDLRSRIDRIAARVLQETGVPSTSIAVVQHDKLVYTQAYGSARLATDSAPAVPAMPEMRYSIGSISKQFTAAFILPLEEKKKLSLDTYPDGEFEQYLIAPME